ncbi:MAG: hypothetical protein WCA19_06280 [Candidatus Acidiferrales bacterium]
MKCLFTVLTVVTLAVSGFGQIAACPATASRSSCKSFQQMRAAKDADIVKALAEEVAFVCFSPKKDRFFTVGFSIPSSGYWFPDGDSNGKYFVEDWARGVDVSIHASGSVSMQFFEDGMSDQTLLFWNGPPNGGPWRAMHAHIASAEWVIAPSDLAFFGDCNDPGSSEVCGLTIDQAEIKMDESISHHSVTIRRSTKRFFETVGDETVTGQCLEFRKATKPRAKTP